MVRIAQENYLGGISLPCSLSLTVYLCYLLHIQSKIDISLGFSPLFTPFCCQFIMDMFSDKVIQQIKCWVYNLLWPGRCIQKYGSISDRKKEQWVKIKSFSLTDIDTRFDCVLGLLCYSQINIIIAFYIVLLYPQGGILKYFGSENNKCVVSVKDLSISLLRFR